MTDGAIQTNIFDYAALDSETRMHYQNVASEYRTFAKRTSAGIVEFGSKFAAIRKGLRHNKAGGFDAWLATEGIDRTMAFKFITVFQTFGNCSKLLQLEVGTSALYLLAAASTPEPARMEAIERAEAGEPITYSKAQQIVNEYKHTNDLLKTANDAVIEGRQPMEPPDTDDDWELAYEPGTPAYCKYCYETHDAWELQDGEAWVCVKCDHATADQYMHVEDEWSRDRRDRAAHLIEDMAEEAGLAVDIQSVGYAPISDRSNYDGDEWKTPPEWIATARLFLGQIDLDPASNDAAQQIVQASSYFNKDENGLERPWCRDDGSPARVWCNPPYSTQLIKAFAQKAIREYDERRMGEGLLLVNNCTDTGWFFDLAVRLPVMFSRGRIRFWYDHPEDETPTRQGQTVFYFGPRVAEFYEVFGKAQDATGRPLAYAPNRGQA